MWNFFPERFSLIRNLRDGRDHKTFIANDYLLEKDNVVLKIIMRDHVPADRSETINRFSWLVGTTNDQLANIHDVGFSKQKHLYLVRDYLPFSELFTLDPCSVMQRLLSAIALWVQHRRVHGAIKPSNIFITQDICKLADPLLRASWSYDDAECIHFTAPEVLAGAKPTQEADLYSIGAVLYRVLTGRHLFEDPDLGRLKSKYLSAVRHPAPFWSPVMPLVPDLILGLLSQNPAKRLRAFELLKNVSNTNEIATGEYFVGRQESLDEVLGIIQQPEGSLKVVLIDGEIGVGKSKFLTQIGVRCALLKINFVSAKCDESPSQLTPIRTAVNKLLKTQPGARGPDFDISKPQPAGNNFGEGATPKLTGHEYPTERQVSDVISTLGLIARHNTPVLALDDIHLADASTVVFLEQLAFRASDVPVTLLLTTRPTKSRPKWLRTFVACLDRNFYQFHMPPLTADESEQLAQFVLTERERLQALHFSAGNPLMIQQYAKATRNSSHVKPQLFSDIVSQMLSAATRPVVNILQILSIFEDSVDFGTLAFMCDISVSELQNHLSAAGRIGLISSKAETVRIRFPILRMKLYRSISKRRRTRLNQTAFVRLRDSTSNPASLAHCAFEAGMLIEAAALYADAAHQAYKSRTFGTALMYYERLEQCRRLSNESLTPAEKGFLAICYDQQGRQRLATRLYRELLSVEQGEIQPELRCTVYTRLAMTAEHLSREERGRLLELGLENLPSPSGYIRQRTNVCNACCFIGDIASARQALTGIDESGATNYELALLNTSRATVLFAQGDFRGAAECYSVALSYGMEQSPLFLNLAICFEHLGDMTTALRYAFDARDRALESGVRRLRLLALNALGAIKMKCGELLDAECLLHQVEKELTSHYSYSIVNIGMSTAVQADIVIHALWKGNYALAERYLKRFRVSPKSSLNITSVLSETARCKFYIAVGLTNKVREQLRRLGEASTFATDFVQIERVLIEAQLPEIDAKSRVESLGHSLMLSEKLGTSYQRCELLIAIAVIHFELGQRPIAESYAKRAVGLASEKAYKILEVRAALIFGLASEKSRVRKHFLSEAMRLASELGLQELVAEAAYHLGVLNIEIGNIATAREYLIRSTTITARLAEGVPVAAKAKYLAKVWRRDAIQALDRCNESMPLHAATMLNLDSDKYFDGAYRLTMSAATVNSAEELFSVVEKTLIASINRSAVVVIQQRSESRYMTVRTKMSTELAERVDTIKRRAKGRVFFESEEKSKQSIGWVPFNSETWDGGMYVICRSHEPQFSEKEIELLTMVGTIASTALKRLEARKAQEAQPQELTEFHGMIGASKSIREVYSQIQMAAGNTANVLVEGESGTGKELVAKAIHAAGPRAKEPFIPVDCGAIPEGLIEAELFGAKKGSYTGAVVDRPGLFEAAHRGTIFLDEISNTTLVLQAKLLRVIQERELRRIGETKGRSIDVRLIVASNQNLEALVEAGKFRKDLLYRLNVLHIKVPSLRNRREDIPMLAHAFLKKLNTTNNTKKYFVSEVIEHLCTQAFPGNVRELQNAIERAFFLAKGIMITRVPLEAQGSPADKSADEVQTWFKEISEGRKDFWSVIHNRYKRRDISREKVVAFVDFGLRSTRGSYKTMASSFRLKEKEYRRFMDFLRRNDCLLDFRPYRKAATARSEN
jgi:DNA-binding NtrC family response regulator/tetratricopeptide (TPR) repeat protein